MADDRIIPDELERALAQTGRRLELGASIAAELPAVIAGLSQLPANSISQGAPAIAYSAKLHPWRPEPSSFARLFKRRLTDKEQLLLLPGSEYLFLFHMDGRMREASLHRVSGALPSAFLFAAVVFRLNDWVPPVRAAALECLNRCLPLTGPNVIAKAAPALLLRQDSWQRWGDERKALEDAFGRPDAAALLADILSDAAVGPGARLLRRSLQYPAMDQNLHGLADRAKQPAVRAIAVKAMARGMATWTTGKEWKWIDKSMGHRVLVNRYQTRELSQSFDQSSVVQRATHDPSPIVRKAALDALILDPDSRALGQQIASQMNEEANPSIQARVRFLLRR